MHFLDSEFPNGCKKAMAAPVHKKNSTLDKSNFRPDSKLLII